MTTLGVEMEMVLARADTGAGHRVGSFFRTLQRLKLARGDAARLSLAGDIPTAVQAPWVTSSLDNAYNNLESAIGVVPPRPAPGRETFCSSTS